MSLGKKVQIFLTMTLKTILRMKCLPAKNRSYHVCCPRKITCEAHCFLNNTNILKSLINIGNKNRV